MSRSEQMAALSEQEWDVLTHDLNLTPRQTQIARLVAAGMPDKQIAWQLGVSFSTVRAHMSQLFEKCGVSSRLELLAHIYAHLHRPWQNHALLPSQCGSDTGPADSGWIRA
jgi:DNA-binding NarL/FixJ family response regulator